AHPWEQVRAVAHRLHATRHRDLDVADGNALRGEHHRLQPRAAHLADRQRRDVVREPAVERRLPCRRLPQTGRDDIPENALFDACRIEAGSAHGLPHDEGTELWRGEILQASEKPAGGRTDGGDDDRFLHSAIVRCRWVTWPAIDQVTHREPCVVLSPRVAGTRRDEEQRILSLRLILSAVAVLVVLVAVVAVVILLPAVV